MHHLRMNTKFFTQCLIIALSVCDGFKIVQSGTPEKVAETEHSNTPHQVYPRSFGIFSRHGHESRHEGSLFGHIGNVLAPVRGIIDHAKKFIPGHHQPHPARVHYDEDRHSGDHQPYQDRPNKQHHVGPNRPYDERPHGRPHQPNHERPHYERPHERPHQPNHERPHYERPHERPHRPNHERPHNERPHERPHRPHHDRPHRPNHERPHRPNQERPSYDDYPDGSHDDRPNKDRPYQPGQQQPNRPDKQRPNRPDNQRPNQPDNQRPRPPIKEEVDYEDYEDYEDTKVDKQPPSWEDIGEHPNRDIPYEDIIQPRRRPKRFIESKIYHVPLQFRSNAKPYKVRFKKEKRVAKH